MRRLALLLPLVALIPALTNAPLSSAADAEGAPPAPGIHRFAVIGDYGNGGTGEGQVAALIDGLDPHEVLTTGDNSYGANPIDVNIGQFYSQYIGNYQGTYGPGSPTNRFFPALGNHEYTDGGGLDAYLDYFTLPGNERYYDVVLGPVHVFAINSNAQEPDGITATSAQAQWLRARLAASTSPWQVVILHHAPFSSGPPFNNHGSIPSLQWPFATWGVDAVLAGHDHHYERLEIGGIPYFVDGLGGVSRTPTVAPVAGSVVRFNTDDGALLLDACPGRLDFSFHTVASGVIDNRRVGGSSCTTQDVGALTQRRFRGSVSRGNLASLGAVDGNRLVLREGRRAGRRATSRMQFRWNFLVPAHNRITFVLDAHHSFNREGDDMVFEWSRNGGPFRLLTTVRRTRPGGPTRLAQLGAGPAGTVTVRVRDTDRTPRHRMLDTVAIDRMLWRVTPSG